MCLCASPPSCRTRLMRIRTIRCNAGHPSIRHRSHFGLGEPRCMALELFKCALFLFTLQIAKRCLINFLLFSSFFCLFSIVHDSGVALRLAESLTVSLRPRAACNRPLLVIIWSGSQCSASISMFQNQPLLVRLKFKPLLRFVL